MLQVTDNKGETGFKHWLKVPQPKVEKVPQATTAAMTANTTTLATCGRDSSGYPTA